MGKSNNLAIVCLALVAAFLVSAPPSGAQQSMDLGFAEAASNTGQKMMSLGDYPQAAAYFRSALAQYEKAGSKEGVAEQNANLGKLAILLGDLRAAQAFLSEALRQERELDRKLEIARIQNDFGKIFLAMDNIQMADQVLSEALDLLEGLDRPVALGELLGDVGVLLSKQGQIDRAQEVLERSVSLLEGSNGQALVTSSLNNLGIVYSLKREHDKARSVLLRALLANEVSARGRADTASNFLSLGRNALIEGQPYEGCQYLRASHTVYKERNAAEAAQIEKVTAGFGCKMDPEKALESHVGSIVLGFSERLYEHLNTSRNIDQSLWIIDPEVSAYRQALTDLLKLWNYGVGQITILRVQSALTGILEGNPQDILTLFSEVERTAASAAPPDSQRATRAARHQGILALLSDPDASMAAFKRSLEYSPDDPDTLMLVGSTYLRAGDEKAAEEIFGKIEALAKGGAAGAKAGALHEAHGSILYRRKAQKEAIAEFEKALSAYEADLDRPRIPVVAGKLGQAYLDTRNIRVFENRIRPYFNIEEDLDRYEVKAVAEYSIARKLFAGSESEEGLGILLQSIEHFQALGRTHSEAVARYVYAISQQRMGDIKGACQSLGEASALQKTVPWLEEKFSKRTADTAAKWQCP